MTGGGEDSGAIAWLADKAWGIVVALLAVTWQLLTGSIRAQKRELMQAFDAHAKEDERRFADLEEEQRTQRSHIGKLFDKLEEHGRRSEERHLELLRAMHTGLAGKADK